MAIEEAFIMQRARQLYWQGYLPAEIARLMGINQNTVYSWKKRDEWDATPPIQRVTTSIDARLIQLTTKDKKTGGDFKEIDLLTRQLKSWTTAQQLPSRRRRSARNKTISQSRRLQHCARIFSARCIGIKEAGTTTTTGATA